MLEVDNTAEKDLITFYYDMFDLVTRDSNFTHLQLKMSTGEKNVIIISTFEGNRNDFRLIFICNLNENTM